ncbi:hypothetical protein GIB67_015430 [Kingdonia uniflora]|uniref:Uncharacterized protein n=1 Tax=Kingdonia uniflora TaxID=39325 RepID=A0A7J7KZ19_9MAGN|nr:hypothetical protein GIB67_015430 [Kingdonia uniflora]
MGRPSVDVVSTFSRMNESDSEGEGVEQFLGFPVQLVSYPPGSDAFSEFCKAKGAIGGMWGVKSIVERKGSLLGEVAEEETELNLILGELGLSRKKKVKSRSKTVVEAQSTRSMTSVDKVDDLKEVVERVRLAILKERKIRARWLLILSRGFGSEVDAIKADTYVEDEEEEAEVLGGVDGLDGVSPQTGLDNQGDNVELPEVGSEKVVREMSLRINDLESGLSRERETSKALLSAQAELQVKEKDSGIKKGLKDLSTAIERVENLQRQVDTLVVKGKQADIAQYRIQALEQTEELC